MMKTDIVNRIKSNRLLRKAWLIKQKNTRSLYLRAKWFSRKIRNHKNIDNDLPTTLQLPITYKCNFDCVMCGMRKLISKKGFSSKELQTILSDKLFNKIESVGVNGGEPFILPDIDEYINVILNTLPNLKNIYVISNGYFTDKILAKSKRLLQLCHNKNVRFHLSISIDGYGKMQDIMRGHKDAFNHSVETIKTILSDRKVYCDSIGAICTITKVNVYNLAELDTWAMLNSIPINYNIATIHKRISNDEKYADFSVFIDKKAQMCAAEFFYSKFLKERSERYYALYYFVRHKKRISICEHQRGVVTLTPNGEISYCATHSKELGNALKLSAYDIFFDAKNLKYRNNIKNNYCASCSHYSECLQPKYLISKYEVELKRLEYCYL